MAASLTGLLRLSFEAFSLPNFEMIALLLSTLFLALSVAASPAITVRDGPITLPISRRLNSTNVLDIYQHDFKRAQALRSRGKAGVDATELVSTPATNQDVSYIANIDVGDPPTQCECSTYIERRSS